MSKYILILGLVLCLFACSEETPKPPVGGAPVADKDTESPQDKTSEKQDKDITLPTAKRFAPHEWVPKPDPKKKPPLTGNVPDRLIASEDGRLLVLPRSPAGKYEFKVGEIRCSLTVVDQPHALPDVPVACDRACACALDGKVYVFGGRIEQASHTGFAHFYNPATKKWSELPSMLPRQRAAGVALNGQIYVIGGHAGDDTPVVEIFDPEKKEWSDGPPLKAARYGGCAAVVDGRIYYIGGWLSCHHKHIDGRCGGDPTGTAEVLDPEKDEWERFTKLPTARAFAACTAIGTKIYVAGGYCKSGEVSVLEVFDTQSSKWEKGPDMPGVVACCGSCEVEGRLFVFGGFRDKQYLDEVVSFDPGNGTWRKEKPLDFARENMAVAEADGKVYLFGGMASALLLPAAEVYEPVSSGDGGDR
jgi:N-acetylneuraminic acid mutarotase